jgi:hypothetical protein
MLDLNLRTLGDEERVALSRTIVELLNRWGVQSEDQVKLLGLPSDTKPRALRRYYENTPLPNSPEINERIDHLLGIADALIHDGIGGLLAVRTHLDCAYDWYLSGSRY